MRRLGADCFVVVRRRGNARGAKGAGHRHLDRVNRQWEEPNKQWKAAAFARWHEPDESSVMSGSVGGSGSNSPGDSAKAPFRVRFGHVRDRLHRYRIAALRQRTARPAKPRKSTSQKNQATTTANPAAAIPVMTQQQDQGHSSLKSSGTSPNFFSTTASENLPTF